MTGWIRAHGAAIMLLALFAMLLAMVILFNAIEAENAMAIATEPAESRIYTDDSGATRMDLYYRLKDIPDKNGVPSSHMYGNGLRWRFDAVTGPVETEIGACWIASYTRLEYQ